MSNIEQRDEGSGAADSSAGTSNQNPQPNEISAPCLTSQTAQNSQDIHNIFNFSTRREPRPLLYWEYKQVLTPAVHRAAQRGELNIDELLVSIRK